MSINVKPLADRVIIEPAAAEEKTAAEGEHQEQVQNWCAADVGVGREGVRCGDVLFLFGGTLKTGR